MGDIMIYGQSDILSKYTDIFSLNSLNSISMEGKNFGETSWWF